MSRRFAIALALLAPGPLEAQVGGEGQVPVLVRAVPRGEIISAADFAFDARPPSAARGALGPEDAAGMEARRAMSPGTIVRATDLVAPRVIRRGEPVLVAFRRGGLTITSRGRALASAGAGEVVRVVAEGTQRTLDGIAVDEGLVLIGR